VGFVVFVAGWESRYEQKQLMAVDQQKLGNMTIYLDLVDPKAKTWQQYEFPFEIVWAFYRVSKELGPADAFRLAALGVMVDGIRIRDVPGQDVELLTRLTPSTGERLEFMIDQLWQVLLKEFPKQVDFLLDTSYKMLRNGYFSRSEAAEFASQMLGKPIESEAWRKRVNKFARDRGRDPLDLPKGRPKKPEE
jgi:hypothetical protein